MTQGISRYAVVLLAALGATLCGCGTDDSDPAPPPAPVAVLSAFPAELAPLLEHATIDETVEIEGRPFRVGHLGGVPVVLGMTGIGLANATLRASAVLDRFDVAGVIVSGVGGSPLRIGDVAVPTAWTLLDGVTYPPDTEWLALAEQIITPGAVALERCTNRPDVPSHDLVCMLHEPAIFIGGLGQSADPFGDVALRCRQNGDDVFGCDVEPAQPILSAASLSGTHPRATVPLAGLDAPTVEDMETAAIARAAAMHGVRFIAFRAVSDGNGDPLDLPGFPGQFFAYYRLAARNAAAATVAFLEQLARKRG